MLNVWGENIVGVNVTYDEDIILAFLHGSCAQSFESCKHERELLVWSPDLLLFFPPCGHLILIKCMYQANL